MQPERGYPLVSVFVPTPDGGSSAVLRAEALILRAEQRLGFELSPVETADIVGRLRQQAYALDLAVVAWRRCAMDW